MIKYKTIIGRYELVSFKDLVAYDVPAKIDSGAFYSSVNASDIEIHEENGIPVLNCKIFSNHKAYPYSREFSTTDFELKKIENSFGESEERYVVMLKVTLANKVVKTPFSLANRSKKTFPILIGRKLLNRRYLIDPSISNIGRKMIEEKMPKAITGEEGYAHA